MDRLLEAHGVVLGKTRMHELAVGVTTINMHGGPVLNPYNNVMHTGGLYSTPLSASCMVRVCQLKGIEQTPFTPQPEISTTSRLSQGLHQATTHLTQSEVDAWGIWDPWQCQLILHVHM